MPEIKTWTVCVGDRLPMTLAYRELLRAYTGGASFEEVRLLAVEADRIRLAVVTNRVPFLPLDLWLREHYCGFGGMSWLVHPRPQKNFAVFTEEAVPKWWD